MYINKIKGVERDTDLTSITQVHVNYRMNFDKIKKQERFKHIKRNTSKNRDKNLDLFKEKNNKKK